MTAYYIYCIAVLSELYRSCPAHATAPTSYYYYTLFTHSFNYTSLGFHTTFLMLLTL